MIQSPSLSATKYFKGGFGDFYNYSKQSSSVLVRFPLSGVPTSKDKLPDPVVLFHRLTSPGAYTVNQ